MYNRFQDAVDALRLPTLKLVAEYDRLRPHITQEKTMSDIKIPNVGKIIYGHSAIDEVMQWFAFGQLPDHLKAVSRQVGVLAHDMAMEYGEHGGPELTKGLAKLLEAKDCLVRAALRKARKEAELENAEPAEQPTEEDKDNGNC